MTMDSKVIFKIMAMIHIEIESWISFRLLISSKKLSCNLKRIKKKKTLREAKAKQPLENIVPKK